MAGTIPLMATRTYRVTRTQLNRIEWKNWNLFERERHLIWVHDVHCYVMGVAGVWLEMRVYSVVLVM